MLLTVYSIDCEKNNRKLNDVVMIDKCIQINNTTKEDFFFMVNET